jgi:hypothetical protein
MDTNVIIDFSVQRLAGKVRDVVRKCIDEDPQISIITKRSQLITRNFADFKKVKELNLFDYYAA